MATSGKTANSDDEIGGNLPQPLPPPQISTALIRTEDRSRALARPLGMFGRGSLMRYLLRDLERFIRLGALDLEQFLHLGAPGRQRSEDRRREPNTALGAVMFIPTVEIVHRDDHLIVNVDLPGLSASELRFTVEDRALVIAGELDVVSMERAGDVWRGQRSSSRFYPSGRYPSGRFQRVIPLREGVDPASAGARFENGVLEIRLRARRQWSRARQIEIDTGSAQPDRPGRSPRVKP
jgi:HSP20 family molecular chaperone IbpA